MSWQRVSSRNHTKFDASAALERRRFTRFLLGCLIASLIFIVMAHLITEPVRRALKFSVDPHEVVEAIGVGLLVASVCGLGIETYIFRGFTHTVGRVFHKIDGVKNDLDVQTRDLNALTDKLSGLDDKVKATARWVENLITAVDTVGLVDVFRDRSGKWQKAVIDALHPGVSEVKLMGTALRDILGDVAGTTQEQQLKAHLSDAIRGGGSENTVFKVLLADPDGDGVKARHLQVGQDRPVTDLIREQIDYITALAEENCGRHRIELRLYSEVPSFMGVITDSTAIIEHYIPGQRGGTNLILQCKPLPRPHAGALYAHYSDAFDRIWERATPVVPTDKSKLAVSRRDGRVQSLSAEGAERT